MRKKIALLSVDDKAGIVAFAEGLIALNWAIFATESTAKALRAADIKVTDVADFTGLAPCLDGRVKTLVPQVHGGLLAEERHRAELERLGWPWIDLVCVNLHPLMDEIRKPHATRDSVIEQTDIGGPTLLRSGAKGRRIVVCDPKDYDLVLQKIAHGKADDDTFITALCAKAENLVGEYCLASSRFHQRDFESVLNNPAFR